MGGHEEEERAWFLCFRREGWGFLFEFFEGLPLRVKLLLDRLLRGDVGVALGVAGHEGRYRRSGVLWEGDPPCEERRESYRLY